MQCADGDHNAGSSTDPNAGSSTDQFPPPTVLYPDQQDTMMQKLNTADDADVMDTIDLDIEDDADDAATTASMIPQPPVQDRILFLCTSVR